MNLRLNYEVRLFLSGFLVLLLIGIVSADLCKAESGYYVDCGESYYWSGDSGSLDSGEVDDSVVVYSRADDYESCVDICMSRYYGYSYSRYRWNDRLRLRDECFEDCKVDKNHKEEVKHIEVVKDRGSYYSASFEESYVIVDEYEDYYGEDNYEYSYLDKRDYEIKKNYYGLNSPYGSVRDAVYVYVPYDYSGEDTDSVYDWSVVKEESECGFWCWLGFD